MAEVPTEVADEARASLERMRDLIEFGLTADRATRQDDRRWYQSVLRSVADVVEEAKKTEFALSSRADSEGILKPAEIAESAGITRAAVFRRRQKR